MLKQAVRKLLNLQVKETLTPRSIWGTSMHGGVSGSLPRSGRPYSQVAWVYTCVSLKEQSVQQLGYRLVSSATQEDVLSGPLVALMENPNPDFDWFQLLGAMSVWMDLEGEAHWHMERGVGSRVIALWPLNPQYMVPDVDKRGNLVRWRYSYPATSLPSPGEAWFRPQDVITWKTYNPWDPIRGLSPLSAGRSTIDVEYASHRFDEQILANAGTIGGAYSTDQHLSRAQVAELVETIRSRYGGIDNSGKSIMLHSGLKYDPTSWSPKDLMMSELKNMSRVEICGLFKVPPQKVGIPESQTYSNYEEADKHYWTVAILPRARDIIRKLSLELCPLVQPGTQYELDVSGVEALQDRLTDKLAQAKQMVELGVPPNQAFEFLRLNMPHLPHGDEAFITVQVESYDRIVNPPEPVPLLPSSSEPPDAEKIVPLIAAKAVDREERLRAEFNLAEKLSAPQRQAEAQAVKALNRYYYEFRTAALRRMDVWMGDSDQIIQLHQRTDADLVSAQMKAGEADPTSFIFAALGAEVDPMFQRIAPYLQLSYVAGVRQVLRNPELPSPEDLLERMRAPLEEHLRERQLQIQGLENAGELRRKMSEELADGLLAGDGQEAMAARVKRVFDTTPDAMRIARTETTMAINEARYESAVESDATKHKWLTVADEAVRHAKNDDRPLGWVQSQKEAGVTYLYGSTPNHRILHGEVTVIGERFANGYLYPQSGGAVHGNDAGESINCRCMTIQAVSDNPFGGWEEV